MAKNNNLSAAKSAKNDEFYTRLEDINEELQHYKDFFKNKIVYCNCDDGNWSNFWRFFYANFEFFGIRKLIATSYHKDDTAFKYEYLGGYDRSDYVKNDYLEGVIKTPLTENGDFRSEECINILKESDIVVTNPPFSLFKEYIPFLVKYNKKFLVIGPMNANTYKEIFPLIKNNKVWHGYEYVKEFIQPDGSTKKFGNIHWYTNIEHNKRHHAEEYYAQYSEEEYSRYDNYNAIEVSKVKNIPCDWTGEIGVPITFLDKYCPEQFEIIGSFNASNIENKEKEFYVPSTNSEIIEDGVSKLWNGPIVNKQALYKRIIIKWKPEAMPTINDGVILYGKQKSDRSESGKE